MNDTRCSAAERCDPHHAPTLADRKRCASQLRGLALMARAERSAVGLAACRIELGQIRTAMHCALDFFSGHYDEDLGAAYHGARSAIAALGARVDSE